MESCNFLAPNGKPSLLYSGLEQEYGKDKALEMWYRVRSEAFLKDHPWDGEHVGIDTGKQYNLIKVTFQGDNIDRLIAGSKATTIRSKAQALTIGLERGKSAIFEVKGKKFVITSRGPQTIVEAGGKEAMINSEGVNHESNFKYKQIKDWVNGKGQLYVYDIRPLDIGGKSGKVSLDINGEPTVDYVKSVLGVTNKPATAPTSTESVKVAILPGIVPTDKARGVQPEEIEKAVRTALDTAAMNPDKIYQVTDTAFDTGHAVTPQVLARTISGMAIPLNVHFAESLDRIIVNQPDRFIGDVYLPAEPALLQPDLLKREVDQSFVKMRDSEGNETGGYFSAEKQHEATNSIMYLLRSEFERSRGTSTMNQYKESVQSYFEQFMDVFKRLEQGDSVKGFENITPKDATRMVANYQDVLNAFHKDGEANGLWNFAVKKMEAYQIFTRKLPASQMTDEQLSDLEQSIGHGLKDYSDSTFEHDPKDTASGRIKYFISTTEDSALGDEAYPREVKLTIPDAKDRSSIVKGVKEWTSRSEVTATDMGLTPGKQAVTKIDGKEFRVTATEKVVDAEKASALTGEKVSEGDILIKLEPYEPKSNILTTRKNYLGLPKLADFETLYDNVTATLADKEELSVASYVQALQDSGSPNNMRLAQRLQNASADIQNEFVSVMSLTYNPFTMGLWRTTTGKDGIDYLNFRMIDSNRAGEINTTVQMWKENQKFSPILETRDNGTTVMNQGLVKEFNTRLKDLNAAFDKKDPSANSKALSLMKDFLGAHGIELPDDAYKYFLNKAKKLTNRTTLSGDFRKQFAINKDGSPAGILSTMITRMEDTSATGTDGDEASNEYEQELHLLNNNPLYTEGTATRLLAKLNSQFTPGLQTYTHKDSQGNTIHSYGFNSKLSKSFRALKMDELFRNTLAQATFSSTSWLLSKIKDNGELRSRIALSYLDGLKQDYSSRDGIPRGSMSMREQLLMSIGLFQNQGYSTGHYMSLTHADKTKTPVFRNLPKITDVTTQQDQGEGLIQRDINPEVYRTLYNSVFLPEFNRIHQGKSDTVNSEDYRKGSQYFYMLPYFNKGHLDELLLQGRITKDVVSSLRMPDGSLNTVTDGRFKNAVLKVLQLHVEDMVKDTMNEWKDNKLDEEGLPFAPAYTRKLLKAVGINYDKKTDQYASHRGETWSTEQITPLLTELAARDYTINSFLVNSSLSQLLYGDPALSYKKGQGDIGTVDATLKNYNKRLSKDIAPGGDGNWEPGEKYQVVALSDYQPVVAEIGGVKVNATDAQELTTMKEHLDVMYAYGKIESDLYHQMLSIINTPDKDGYYEFTDPAHLAVVLQAMKPVYAGVNDLVNNVLTENYVKSSSYPLIPQVTRGLEIDHLRKAMESHEVARAYFESAGKLGNPSKPLSVFDSNGSVYEGIFEGDEWKGAQQQFLRSNFRIQQDNPYDENKESIRTASQANNNITQGIEHNPSSFNIDDKQMTGKEVVQYKQDLRKQLIALQAERFDKSTESKSSIWNMLSREVDRRPGYTPGDKEVLSMRDENDDLIIPLLFAPSLSKLEPVMMSSINKVSQIQIPGKSYIQASSAGFKGVKEWETMTAHDKNSITWIDGYHSSELKTLRVEDGIVKPAQVLAPFTFFDARGNRTDVSTLTRKDELGRTVVDPEKLPEEFRRLIGLRIPNQGHNSMLPIEIVGYLPPSMGDLVIVPSAITHQMGSDFDVDKLYSYKMPYNYDVRGITHVTDRESELKKEYVNLHWGILMNKDMISRVLEPLDKPDLKDLAKEYSKSGISMYYSPMYQMRDFISQKDAKNLVGTSSLFSKFNTLAQDKDLTLGHTEFDEDGKKQPVTDVIKFRTEDGKVLALTTLSGYGKSKYGESDRTKHDNVSIQQNEFLDHAKNRTIDNLNLTIHTFPASGALSLLQEADRGIAPGRAVNLEVNIALLKQPILVDYSRLMSQVGDSIGRQFGRDVSELVVEQLVDKYGKDLSNIERREIGSSEKGLDVAELKKTALKTPATPSKDYAIQQLEVLHTFLKLDTIGSQILDIQNTLNQDVGGVGKSLMDAINKKEAISRIQMAMDSINIMDTQNLIINPETGALTESGYTFHQTVDKALDTYREILPYEKLIPAFSSALLETGRVKMNQGMQDSLLVSIKSFVFSSSRLGLWRSSMEERSRLLYSRPDSNSLAMRVREAVTTWGVNNYFLKRLSTDIDVSHARPDYITYTASKASRLDDYENKKSIIDMLTAGGKPKELAIDLIRYVYATGGVQGSYNFVKHIPQSYLAGTEFAAGLKDFHENLEGAIDHTFIQQWLQHNPQYAHALSLGLTESGTRYEHYPEQLMMPALKEGEANSSDKVLIRDSETGVMSYPEFLSYRSQENNQWILYQKQSMYNGDETGCRYQRIDTLGDKFMSEYQEGEANTRSLIPGNRALYEPFSGIEAINPSLQEEATTERSKEVLQQIGITSDRGTLKDVTNALEVIASDDQQPQSLRVIADMLKDLQRNQAEKSSYAYLFQQAVPKFELHIGAVNGIGVYDSGRNILTINDSRLTTTTEAARALTHEMLHYHTALVSMIEDAGTDMMRSRFLPGQLHYFKQGRDYINLNHPELTEAMQNLTSVREQALSELKRMMIRDGHNDYDARIHAFANGKKLRMDYYDNMLYGLASNTEFIAHIFNSPTYMRFLDTIQDKDQTAPRTLAQKFKDWIAGFFKTLTQVLGRDVTKGSLLESAIHHSMDIMTYTKPTEYNADRASGEFQNIWNMSLGNDDDITGVNRVVGKLQEQVQELQSSLTGLTDKKDLAFKYKKLDDIKADIRELQASQDAKLVNTIGLKQMGWVREVITNKDASPNEVMTASRILDLWTNVTELMYGATENVQSADPQLAKIVADAQLDRKSLTAKAENILLGLGDKTITSKDFSMSELVDMSWASARLRNLSSASKSRVVQFIATFMEDAGRHRDQDMHQLIKETHEIRKDMSGYGNLQDLFDKMRIKPGMKGDQWGLIQKYSPVWYDTIKSLKATRDRVMESARGTTPEDRAGRKAAMDRYWKSLEKGTSMVDTRLLFEPNTGELKDDAKARAEKERLREELGPEADKAIQDAQVKYQKYVDERDAYFDSLESSSSEKTPEEIERDKQIYISRNSPNTFFDNHKSVSSVFRDFNTDRFVYMVPKITEDKFYDQDYKKMMGDTKLASFYTRIKGTLDRLKSYLPQYVQDQMGDAFLPVVHKNLLSDVINLPQYFKTIGSRFIDAISATDEEANRDGRSTNSIPIRYTNPGSVDPSERSTDLIKIIDTFGMMALHYKHFADVKDVVEMGESILKEIDRSRKAGTAQVVQNGRVVTVDKGLTNTLEALKYMKEYMLYKRARALEGDTGKKVYRAIDPKDRGKEASTVKELLKQIHDVETRYKNGELTYEEYQEKIDPLNTSLSKYEGRTIYGSKIGDKLISINQLKTLSYNPFSGIANVTFGLISAWIHAAGQEDYTRKELLKSFWMTKSSMLKYYSLGTLGNIAVVDKLLTVMNKLDVIGDIVDTNYGKNIIREDKAKWKRLADPYAIMRAGDYYMKAVTTTAMLLHQQVDVVEGGVAKKVSIWDALNDQGEWNEKRFGKNEDWRSEDSSNERNWDKLRNHVLRTNMIIHGNQDKNSPKMANQKIFGRLLGQFRMSWLPEGWYSRFADEKYDIQLDRLTKGRYRTIADIGIGGYLRATVQQTLRMFGARIDPFKGVDRTNGQPMSDVDKANMKRNFSELAFYSTMMASILMLRATLSSDDDDETKKKATQLLINMLIRNRQDLTFYSSPQVFDNVTRSIIPVTQVITDYWKAMQASARLVYDDDYTFDKWIHKVFKAGLPIPQATLINKTQYMLGKDLDVLQSSQ